MNILNKKPLLFLILSMVISHPLLAREDSSSDSTYSNQEYDVFSGALTTGYDNRYIYRGRSIGDDTLWTNLYFEVDLTPDLILSSNTFYTDVISDSLSYSEMNFGLNLSYITEFGTLNFGMLHYQFFDGFSGRRADAAAQNLTGVSSQSDATEIYLGFSKEVPYQIYSYASLIYDLRIDALYLEAGLSRAWQLSEDIDLELGASVGFSIDDYYASVGGDENNGFTHAIISISAPIDLTETVSFTPHVSTNFAFESRENVNANSIGSAEVFIGASLGVSF